MPPLIHALAKSLSEGRVTPVDTLKDFLVRIEKLEPLLRAWVSVDRERALEVAAERGKEIDQGKYRGPLHGMPIGIKDIFDIKDRPTAAGSRLWENSIARHHSTVVRKLEEAGAILVGKTVTTQYASFDPPVTRNPWDPDKTPGGSSSGSAAAVAAGMCPGAIGSQTGGSITRPAAFCGVAGCKPTYGRVSCLGVVPLAPSMDHPGPIAGCVRDVAILLQAIAGYDPGDPVSQPVPVENYIAQVEAGLPRPPRLGRLREIFEERADHPTRAMMDRVCAALADNGAEVVEIALPAGFAEAEARHRIVMAVEAAAYHEQRLHDHPEDYDPCIRSLIEEGLRCSGAEYSRCKNHQTALTIDMESCLLDVDALLMPAALGPAPDASTTGDPVFNSPWSYTGLPAVSFCSGWTEEGMPLGIQLVGEHWGEGPLLAVAEWCEATLDVERREVSVKG